MDIMDIMELFLRLLSLMMLMISFLLSFNKNKDIFSPVKIYAVFTLFFYADIFFNSYDFYIYYIYLINTIIIAVLTVFEPKFSVRNRMDNYISNSCRNKIICFVWLATIVPVFNQLYFIQQLGGLNAVVGNISLRVKYFEGKGYILVLNGLIVILNLIYFVGVVNKLSLKNVALYLCHFVILVLFGLLSGSRSFIVMTILVMFIIYSYYNSRVSLKLASFFAFFLLIGLALLGTLRNNISINEEGFSVNEFSIKDKIELSHFKYGLIPLEIVFSESNEKVEANRQNGLTYFSLITNFIPRIIYPEKLDSGGIFFTKIYANDKWGGYSNLATGAITEGIINFGFFYGVFLGFFLISLFYLLGIFFYRRILVISKSDYKAMIIIPYIYFVLVCARFSFSEFSYVIFNYILTVAIPYVLFLYFIRVSILPENNFLDGEKK